MTDLVLTLPMPPKELNPNHRCNWRIRNKARERYQAEVAVALYQQVGRPAPCYPRVKLVVTFVHRGGQRRDVDNCLASFKAGLDMMVRYGLLPDDSADHLPEVTVRREIQPSATPHVRVHLTKLEEGQ